MTIAFLRQAGLCLSLAVLLTAVASGATAQSRYYFDSLNGSDGNDGRGADHAWKSLSKLDGVRLGPDDAVLLRRGGSWSGQITLRTSGRPGRPIIIAAYGSGAAPVLTDAAVGIDGNGQSHMVVRDLRIQNMKGPAIGTSGSSDWRIERVVIDRTGLGHDGRNRDFAGIQLWKGRDFVIDGVTLTNVRGDGIWGWELQNVRILNSRIEVCQGAAADNVHLHAPRNYEIRGSHFSMEGRTESGKGNVHSQAGSNGVIENNVFRGGTYGVGITDDDLLIRNNQFFNHVKEKWSASIIVSEVYDIRNNTITGNTMTDATMGIYIFRDRYNRENFRVEDNTFARIRRSAMVIESPISGTFAGNQLRDSPGAAMVQSNEWLVRGQKWIEGGNRIVAGGQQGSPERSGQAR
jgi:polysaccharidase protein